MEAFNTNKFHNKGSLQSMFRCVLLTLAVVSVTSAVKCYSGCVDGTIELAGQSQGYPDGECTEETTAECGTGCVTVSLEFDYEVETGGFKIAEGSADGIKTATCSLGSDNSHLCDTIKSSMESDMTGKMGKMGKMGTVSISNMKCDVSDPCEIEMCNDPTKSEDNGKSDGGEDDNGSFVAHGVSFVLLSAALGLLY